MSIDMIGLAELVQVVHNNLLVLRVRAERAKTLNFPSENPLSFIELFIEILNLLEETLETLFHDAEKKKSEHGPGYYEQRVQFIAKSISNLAPLLRFAERANIEYCPWGVVGRLQLLCSRIHKKIRVIYRPRWRYLYDHTLLNNELVFSVYKDKDIVRLIDYYPQFLALSFPSSEKDNILLMSLMGHEIGHMINLVLGAEIDEWGTTFGNLVLQEVEFNNDLVDELVTLHIVDSSSGGKIGPIQLKKIRVDIIKEISTILSDWFEETLADVFAVKLFGPAWIFSFNEIVFPHYNLDIPDEEHPHPRLRLNFQLQELEKLGYLDSQEIGDDPNEDENPRAQIYEFIHSEIKKYKNIVESHDIHEIYIPVGNDRDYLKYRIVIEALIEARSLIDDNIPDIDLTYFYSSDMFWKDIPKLVKLLDAGYPPYEGKIFLEGDSVHILPNLLNAGYIQLKMSSSLSATSEKDQFSKDNYENRLVINKLVLKALDVGEFQYHYLMRKSILDPEEMDEEDIREIGHLGKRRRGSQLSKPDIQDYLSRDIDDDGLVIIPLLSKRRQMQPDGIDVRLGNEFIRSNRRKYKGVDPFEKFGVGLPLEQSQERIYVPIGNQFVLHPGQMALGSTLEYIGMPKCLSGVIHVRSSWGRLGQIIATATKVSPGSKNSPTLELANVGSVPISLYPGVRIGNLSLFELSSSVEYSGVYNYATGPENSKVYLDPELKYLGSPLEKTIIVGITGAINSGKTDIARHLCIYQGFRIIDIEQLIIDEFRERKGEANKRSLYEFKKDLREKFGNKVLLEYAYKKISELITNAPIMVVIDHLDHPDEIRELKKFSNAFIIGVDTEQDLRYNWHEVWRSPSVLLSRDEFNKLDHQILLGLNDDGSKNAHFSFVQECLKLADYNIQCTEDNDLNNSKIENIRYQIEKAAY